MKNIHKAKWFAGLVLLVGLSAFVWRADPIKDLLAQIRSHLQTQRVNLNQEKLYVHLDKADYVAGETVWWKAYLVQASNLQLQRAQEVVHLDLLRPDGTVVSQIKAKAEGGTVHGNINLPDSLEAGDYQLVGYANWMRNFKNPPFFRKNIQVQSVTAEGTQAAGAVAVSPPADLQFFPEGGDWVAGLPARLAFKATDQSGLGVDVEGSIVDEQDRTLVDFKSLHAGMGTVKLTPQENKEYFAVVHNTDGKPLRFALPGVKTDGYVVTVDEYSDEEQLYIELAGKSTSSQPLLLTIIANDQLIYEKTISPPVSQQQVSVAKSQLPTGINRITLATEDGQMLAERLAFIHPEKQLQVSISMDEPGYLKKEEVQLTVETTDAEGNPVPAQLSMSVTDAELVPQDLEQCSIFSHLLLNADLKGYIEQPDYYFKDITPKKKKALSYVMMTHGWRRFGWETLLEPQQPAFRYMQQAALSIDGRLVKENGKPVDKGEVILYVKDQHETFIVEQTDDEGYFSFQGFDFKDSVEVVIQGTTASGSRNVKVLMDAQPWTPEWQPIPPSPQEGELVASTDRTVVRSAQQAAVENAYTPGLKEMMLKEIIVRERRENIVEPFSLHQRADVVIDASSLPPAPSGNILESLQGRIPGVQIYRNGMYNFRAVIRGSGSPLYLLDGMPVDASALIAINQFDLDRIEVLKGPSAAIYGGRGGGGVIALFSKRGGTEYEEAQPGENIIIHRAGGFQQYREFYKPRYSADGQTERPDYRTTLHWEPNIQTDASGKASVSFFTADRATDYRVVVNGISREGLPGFVESSFDVEEPAEVSP